MTQNNYFFNSLLYEGIILPEITKLESSSIDATMILPAHNILSDIMYFITMLAYLNKNVFNFYLFLCLFHFVS